MTVTPRGRGRQWNRGNLHRLSLGKIRVWMKKCRCSPGTGHQPWGGISIPAFLNPQLERAWLPQHRVSTACSQSELEQGSSEVLAASTAAIQRHSLTTAYHITPRGYGAGEACPVVRLFPSTVTARRRKGDGQGLQRPAQQAQRHRCLQAAGNNGSRRNKGD